MNRNPATIPLHDIYSVAFADYKGMGATLIKEGQRVIFLLPDATHTYKILTEFNGNPSIPLLDYLTHLKKLRALMISLRG